MRREEIPKRKQNASCTSGQEERPMEHQIALRGFTSTGTYAISSAS
jgi:hypothetical protein